MKSKYLLGISQLLAIASLIGLIIEPMAASGLAFMAYCFLEAATESDPSKV
jgi:hypothetical protein